MTNEKDRDILPLTLTELSTVVDALNTHYARHIRRTHRHEEKTGEPRSKETSKRLAHIQETLQYVTLMYNIRTKTLNEEVARSAGLTLDEEEKTTSEEERSASEKEQGRTDRDPKSN